MVLGVLPVPAVLGARLLPGSPCRAIADIIANKPPEVVTRIIEVQKPGILPRLFGK